MKPEGQTVAVVIPTYNRAHYVAQAIESALGQTRPPAEVIVVDDGSTDDTASVVSAFGPPVRYVRKENAGKAKALNRVIPEVQSDYVFLLDDDDVMLPKALETHLDFLAKHGDIDFSYGAHHVFGGDGPPQFDSLCSRGWTPVSVAPPEALFIRAMIWFPFYLQAMLVPRCCYEETGPFDESLVFTEDYDMILRLSRAFRGGSIDAPVVCVRFHRGARGPATDRRSESEREAAFRHYEHQIFERLYAALPLIDYLPRGLTTGTPKEFVLRRALLQRACIMSRHGLIDEAFKDLETVLDESPQTKRFSRSEQSILATMLNVESWWLRTYPSYTSFLGRLLRQHHAYTALEACAVGLSWQIKANLRRRQYSDALLVALHLQRLVGVRHLPALALRLLKRRRGKSQRACKNASC